MKNRNISLFVFASYSIFWIMVLGLCGTASQIFHAKPLTMRILSNICAWSPTFTLFLLFKRLIPNESISKFYSQIFIVRINYKLAFVAVLAIEFSIIISVFLVSIIEQKAFFSYFNRGETSILLSVVLSLLSGPTGEESGWRGYLRLELNKKYGFLIGSLLLGTIWAFWHAILWFIDSDFKGINLVIYIFSNIVVMTSLTIIMNIVLEKNNNLLNAIIMHFAFNVLYMFLKVDIYFFVVLSVVFAIISIIYLFVFKVNKRDLTTAST